MVVIGLISSVFVSGLSETGASTYTQRVWYILGDEEYSRKLDSEIFDCAEYWKDEVSFPNKIIWECDRVSEIFLADQVLVSGFFPSDFDKTDLRLTRSGLVSASGCDEVACYGFTNSAKSAAERFERFQYYPTWFSALTDDQKQFLINFNSIIAKYEDVQRVRQIEIAWHLVILAALSLGLFAYIATEVLYRIILYIAFGKSSLRLKLE
jgi:hypothetical protein